MRLSQAIVCRDLILIWVLGVLIAEEAFSCRRRKYVGVPLLFGAIFRTASFGLAARRYAVHDGLIPLS